MGRVYIPAMSDSDQQGCRHTILQLSHSVLWSPCPASLGGWYFTTLEVLLIYKCIYDAQNLVYLLAKFTTLCFHYTLFLNYPYFFICICCILIWVYLRMLFLPKAIDIRSVCFTWWELSGSVTLLVLSKHLSHMPWSQFCHHRAYPCKHSNNCTG